MIIFLQLEENEQNKEKERENEYYFSGERAGCLVSWSVCRCCNCSLLHRTTKKKERKQVFIFLYFQIAGNKISFAGENTPTFGSV